MKRPNPNNTRTELQIRAEAALEIRFRDWFANDKSYISFCGLTGLTLTRGQYVLAMVAFDGWDPIDLPEAWQRDIAARLFGKVKRFTRSQRSVLVAVCGARGGKTRTLIAQRMLHLAMSVALPSLGPGEQASAIIVAPDLRLALQAIRYVHGTIDENSFLKSRIVGEPSGERVVLLRPDGEMVAIECLPATRGGGALRGRTLVGAGLDESAFFRGSDSVVNDVEVFRAVSARIVPGGQCVIASTPWGESGLLYDMHKANHDHPLTAVSAHAPTLEIHDTEYTRDIVEAEYKRDPDNADREFGANFMAGGSSKYFDPVLVDGCIVENITKPRGIILASADFAFERDACSLVLSDTEEGMCSTFHVDEVIVSHGEPLKPSLIAQQFAATCKRFGVREIMGDQHYREAMREHFQKENILFLDAPDGTEAKTETYSAALQMLRENRIRNLEHLQLNAQIKAVTKKALPGGGLKISSPRTPGRHGDICSSWVLNAWRVFKYHSPKAVSVRSRPTTPRRSMDGF